ncbi:APC family permease [Acidocella sp. KAb 2-4]|uniref:APC family permease n=1 Tax=Acidocella sp. KAb 2-4 TaxID=2885158 RepID=UPI001D073B3F|nr:APC family permease [Acidocella sp. KAb 2-4]MCB5944568.1 APC family permease [Acidocella sp. KAb 2-4]
MTSTTLRREAGPIGLLFASIGGMVGSGWLFGALNAAKIAGPAAVFAWVIGGVAVLLLAFVYAELSTMFPRPGAVILFPQLCFGDLAAQIMSWVNFLAYVAVAPVEAVAVVSYAANMWPGLAREDVLTGAGLGAAVALMVLFLVVNLFAIRAVLAVNNAITWWKLAVPGATVAALLLVHFRVQNFTAHGFAPAGLGGVFGAVSGSGIIFTYLGFRQAIELAGESSNPGRNLPFAILGSVLFCILLYAGLQLAFIGALPSAALAQGWAGLNFTGISGPFAGLAAALGLPWLAAALYADAAISPSGTGIIYNTTAARVIYASAHGGLLPRPLARLSRQGVPLASLALAFAAGLVFLLPLPSWRQLVTYLSSIGVLAYGIGPVVLSCFRTTLPEAGYPRPFRLAAAQAMAPAAFIVGNLVVFWAGAAVANHVFGGLLAAFIVYCGWQLATRRTLGHLHWRGAAWLAPYFGGLWLITDLGPLQGLGWLGQGGGVVAIALFSLAVLALARRCALPDPQAAKARYGQ